MPSFSNLDHNIIVGEFKIRYSRSKPYTKKVKYYDRGDYNLMNNLINTVNWDNITQSSTLEDDVSYFTASLTNIIENCIPSRTVKIYPRDRPGFNSHTRKLFKECHRLHKIKNKTGHPIDIERYKDKRREAKTALKLSKQQYYDNHSTKIVSPDTNSKTFLKLVKSVVGENSLLAFQL